MKFGLLWEVIRDKKFGETVIVENQASLGIEALLLSLIEYSRANNTPLLIEDILDTFPIYARHLELILGNLNLGNSRILKIGGSDDIGKIAEKLKFETDLRVYLSRYKKAFYSISPNENFIDLVFGLDRLFALNDTPMGTSELINSIKTYITNKNRLAFYFFELDLMESLSTSPMPLIEELATSVIRITQDRDTIVFTMIKDSWALKAKMKEVRISIRDILGG
ncbi:hypothetical protein DRN82_01535 [Thermococci archaeon]|nr:MAG: hypothetical protein DRN82_01535 [Thermococci archaeon]